MTNFKLPFKNSATSPNDSAGEKPIQTIKQFLDEKLAKNPQCSNDVQDKILNKLLKFYANIKNCTDICKTIHNDYEENQSRFELQDYGTTGYRRLVRYGMKSKTHIDFTIKINDENIIIKITGDPE